MDEFDWFDFVHMEENKQFLKEHLLHETIFTISLNFLIDNNIIIKNQQNTINNKTIKLLNHSAKNQFDIKHGSNKLLTTSNQSKNSTTHNIFQ